MNNYLGKTAVISGGAEGIGYSIAVALGERGMNVVIGDIDRDQLSNAKVALETKGISVLTMQMDVTRPEDWQQLADQALARYGKVHMLVNNAGVGSAPGPLEKTNHKDWHWVIDVNLMGVVYGTEIFVPLIKEHSEGGWLLNVASMAGMGGVPYAGAYTATKAAVVAMSESWRAELDPFDIHVAVLCPAFVKTRIHLSHRNRQAHHKNELPVEEKGSRAENAAQSFVENGIPAELVGKRVVEALEQNEFYIFTHPNHRRAMRQRLNAIDTAFQCAEDSALLADIVDEPVVSFKMASN